MVDAWQYFDSKAELKFLVNTITNNQIDKVDIYQQLEQLLSTIMTGYYIDKLVDMGVRYWQNHPLVLCTAINIKTVIGNNYNYYDISNLIVTTFFTISKNYKMFLIDFNKNKLN